MRQSDHDFLFSPNFNFGTDSVFSAQNNEIGQGGFPPVAGDMDLLDGSDMQLLDGTSMLFL